MNFLSVDIVVLSRAVLGVSALSLMMACSSKEVKMTGPEVFSLSASQQKSRFPQVQNIGVVELSGARIKTRAFEGAADEKEYLATGGAMLLKRVESPIQAHAPEILVTPDAAILRGRQAMVKQGDRLITAGGDDTQFTIDGVDINIQGPHIIRNMTTGKVSFLGGAMAPVEAPKVVPAKPQPVVAARPPVKKPAIAMTSPAPPKKVAAVPPKVTAPARPAPAPKPQVAPVVKPAPKPVAAPAPAPEVNRKELLNLMREPAE